MSNPKEANPENTVEIISLCRLGTTWYTKRTGGNRGGSLSILAKTTFAKTRDG